MARTKKTDGDKTVVTRAEKKDATKNIIRELLAVKPYKHNELIEEVARIYTQNFAGEETDNVNDVKGRVGSVLDIMKKDSDVAYEGGMYALKARIAPAPISKAEEEKPKKATRTRAKKTTDEEKSEKPKTKKATTKKVKTEKETPPAPAQEEIERTPLPPAPLQPIAPAPSVTPEVAPEPMPEVAPKKRGRKAKSATTKKEEKAEKAEVVAPVAIPVEKTEEKAEEKPAEKLPEPPVTEEKKEEVKALIVQKPAPVAAKATVMDMSFLFGDVKAKKPAPVKTEKAEIPVEKPVAEKKTEEKPKAAERKEEKKQPTKQEIKQETKPTQTVVAQPRKPVKDAGNKRRVAEKPVTADEKLREAFLKRMRALGGDYFEYYSVYLLERYSMRNGRRLDAMRITGGDHDGGIDGEIELTDKFGFRETIYIQSKNWDPDKGDEKLWVVGETLLQQFIGACACRQAKDGKQHCRGIFITTSRFTPEAKRILDAMSDKIVGYDGADLYEAAKECAFGLVHKNGEWALDDQLLSGTKAFFQMF